ncbi:hypothetical protein B0H14DRAFT_500752 [Mycena olivaceomarginata]|nr:hypothetical protein B0H14DRAFT_500752 [Mycena olivaceomarginata]
MSRTVVLAVLLPVCSPVALRLLRLPLPIDARDRIVTSGASPQTRIHRSNVPSSASASALHHWHPPLIHVPLRVIDACRQAPNPADAECGRPVPLAHYLRLGAGSLAFDDGPDVARALPFCVRRIAVADAVSERSLGPGLIRERIGRRGKHCRSRVVWTMSSLRNVPAKRDAGAVVCPAVWDCRASKGQRLWSEWSREYPVV